MYNIQYHKLMKKWILWEEIEREHGWTLNCILQGTKKECEEKLNKIKEQENGTKEKK